MRHSQAKYNSSQKKKKSEYKPGTAALLQESKLEHIAKIDLQKAGTD